jgi:hypothetical protein
MYGHQATRSVAHQQQASVCDTDNMTQTASNHLVTYSTHVFSYDLTMQHDDAICYLLFGAVFWHNVAPFCLIQPKGTTIFICHDHVCRRLIAGEGGKPWGSKAQKQEEMRGGEGDYMTQEVVVEEQVWIRFSFFSHSVTKRRLYSYICWSSDVGRSAVKFLRVV